MNKYVLLGIFVAIFVAGLVVILSNESVSFYELMRSLDNLSPRVLGVIVLPFIALLFVLGVYLRRRNEERKWKQALLRTREKNKTNRCD